MHVNLKQWIWLLAAAVAVGGGLGEVRGQSGASARLQAMSDGLADTVEKVMPSVVVVQTEAIRYTRAYDLFWRPVPGQPQVSAGQGSGVIIDTEGHILTSNHVIEGADTVKVVLHDGTAFDAEVVGQDPHTDIGVIRIKELEGFALTPIEPGDSDTLRVGEFVVAVGSPFHLSSSVTMGIVSQKGRTVGVLPYEDFIQTDASINPGNSGGPLVDLEGRMVGINAVIQTDGSRGSIGIGFAVPGNRAFKIARVLSEGGTVERPWLGIVPYPMSVAAARRYANRNGGVYIAEVFRDTPAFKSGLYRGDIILDVNGEPIYSVLDLQREIFKNEIGEAIQVKVLRSNREVELDVQSEQMPDARIFK